MSENKNLRTCYADAAKAAQGKAEIKTLPNQKIRCGETIECRNVSYHPTVAASLLRTLASGPERISPLFECIHINYAQDFLQTLISRGILFLISVKLPVEFYERAFSVNRFPTYVLIDHEGIVRFRASGTNFEREAELNDAIHKQIKIVAKTVPTE